MPASPRCEGEVVLDGAVRPTDVDLLCWSGLELCARGCGEVSREGTGVLFECGAGLKWLHFGQIYSRSIGR